MWSFTLLLLTFCIIGISTQIYRCPTQCLVPSNYVVAIQICKQQHHHLSGRQRKKSKPFDYNIILEDLRVSQRGPVKQLGHTHWYSVQAPSSGVHTAPLLQGLLSQGSVTVRVNKMDKIVTQWQWWSGMDKLINVIMIYAECHDSKTLCRRLLQFELKNAIPKKSHSDRKDWSL